jgi:bifunctional UDP-N-acetylglucosamine pyrophosphorylase/glucosamine-1-phosphate N-acetyltransferase
MVNEYKHKFACVLLAAGQGKRMRSTLPKVMHRIAEKPMIAHVLAALKPLAPERCILVVAPKMESVSQAATKEIAGIISVIQDKQLGTGNAVQCAEAALKGYNGIVLVVYGDTPLLTTETLHRVLELAESADLVALGMRPADPTGYGRLIIDSNGQLEEIIECRDAKPVQKDVTLCNSGVMAVKAKYLFELLKDVGTNNTQGEYYLTDIISRADARDLRCRVVETEANEVIGVNTRAQLAEAEAALQQRLRLQAMEQGATLVDPATVYLSTDTKLGQDVVIYPHVVFGPKVKVESSVEIRSFSHIEGAIIKSGAIVGPFARLRPGAVIGEGAHVGNFVEIKKSTLGKRAKANHLSYIGDADVGAGANIGAGTITCNYDGTSKYQTTIGANAFIGSNTSLVAPVTVGEGAVVGAGSVITEDVEADALAIARAPQVNKRAKAKKIKQ